MEGLQPLFSYGLILITVNQPKHVGKFIGVLGVHALLFLEPYDHLRSSSIQNGRRNLCRKNLCEALLPVISTPRPSHAGPNLGFVHRLQQTRRQLPVAASAGSADGGVEAEGVGAELMRLVGPRGAGGALWMMVS